MNPKSSDRHRNQKFGRTTYAQHGEDLMICNLFSIIGVDRPGYLDLGAHHPYVISNTALLYERGSRGVNVEANPVLLDAFREARPEDVSVNLGVGPERGHSLSTCSPKGADETPSQRLERTRWRASTRSSG